MPPVVDVVVTPLTAVTPWAPALATGVKNTVRPNVGAVAAQPGEPELRPDGARAPASC